MSRAFVKENDAEAPIALPELPVSPHPNYVTAEGLAQLQARVEAVEANLRAIDETAVDGRLERAHLERELRWLKLRIGAAIPVRVPPASPERVDFGATVELVDETEQHYRYRIVGEDEASPEQGLISWVSPLARALKGARAGDSVRWPRPAGDLEVEVLALSY